MGAEAGLVRVVDAGRPGKEHLLDSAGVGAGWIDYDRDGRLDAFVPNGWRIADGAITSRGAFALYRNRGDGSFEEVADQAGVAGDGRWGSGVAVADYDGDGWPDLFVTTFGPSLLYRNRGDGTFDELAEEAGVAGPGWNTGAAFFDADRDGDLDLYVAAYIDTTVDEVLAAKATLDWKGVDNVAIGPFGLIGAEDRYYRAEPGGRFVEATQEAGLTDLGRAYGFGVIAADFDADGDDDLFVANDSDANYLYRNDGDGRFRDIGMISGTAFNAAGAAQAGMGVACGDPNGDGHLDLVVTNFSEDFSTLYLGDGRGFFEDVSEASGVGPATWTALSWGVVFADLDRDGDEDLVIANGHIYPQVDAHPEFGFTYAQTPILLENDGRGTFRDVSKRAGPAFEAPHPSRGLAAGDYDDDGDLDLLITHLDEAPSLLRNDTPGGHWIGVALESAGAGWPVVGAVVRMTAGGRTQVRRTASSGSFLSVHDPRLLFGLGELRRVERVEVRWPDGSTTVLEDPAIDRYLDVRR